MKTKTLTHTVIFKTTPHKIYEIFMDSDRHSGLLGRESIVGREVGDKISIYGNYIDGVNLELEPDKKIVQKWRAKEKGWSKDHFSKVTILIEPCREGSLVKFTQSGVPEECYEVFDRDWYVFYWDPMKEKFQ